VTDSLPLGQPSLLRSLQIQLRVIGALRRDTLTRYGRHNIGFMWIFAEPMMFTTGVVTLWHVFHSSSGHAASTPLVPFCLTGYATVLMWRNTVGRGAESVKNNRPLLFHRNVRILDVYISSLVLEAAGATISFIVLAFGFTFAGEMHLPYDILKMFLAWGLLTWFSMALGLIVGSAGIYSEMFTRLWHIFAYLQLPMCGAFSMLSWLPTKAQTYLLLNPPVSCVELLRAGYFGPSVRTTYHIGYCIIFNLCITLIGLWVMTLSSRKLEDSAL
jgi:capsular polysaccharide transport system permease protein